MAAMYSHRYHSISSTQPTVCVGLDIFVNVITIAVTDIKCHQTPP
jgi:hypothetical protein